MDRVAKKAKFHARKRLRERWQHLGDPDETLAKIKFAIQNQMSYGKRLNNRVSFHVVEISGYFVPVMWDRTRKAVLTVLPQWAADEYGFQPGKLPIRGVLGNGLEDENDFEYPNIDFPDDEEDLINYYEDKANRTDYENGFVSSNSWQ